MTPGYVKRLNVEELLTQRTPLNPDPIQTPDIYETNH